TGAEVADAAVQAVELQQRTQLCERAAGKRRVQRDDGHGGQEAEAHVGFLRRAAWTTRCSRRDVYGLQRRTKFCRCVLRRRPAAKSDPGPIATSFPRGRG